MFFITYRPYDWRDVIGRAGTTYHFVCITLQNPSDIEGVKSFLKRESENLPDGCEINTRNTSVEELREVRNRDLSMKSIVSFIYEYDSDVKLSIDYDK